MARFIAALSSFALFAPALQAQIPAGEADRIRAVLADPAGLAAPGCAVGVFRDGKIATRVGEGAADVAARRPIGPATLFYAASVSKQFTAVAVMQLVVAGKIALGDDIHKYLPELPRYQRPVTVHMLLNHTAGIRDSLALLYLAGYADYTGPTREQTLALTMAQTTTKFEPGTHYDYSNGGYLLLSEIVQRVSGQRFATYVNAHVLKAAGMTHSFILDGKRTAEGDVARGYRVEGGKVELADSYPLFGGSGGLMTTIDDLAAWDRDIDSGHQVWSPAVLKLMTEPGLFNNGAKVARAGRGTYYASALSVGPHWFGHSGGANGFKTYFAHNSAARIGVALLCNRGEVDPAKRADQVVAAIGGLPPISEAAAAANAIDGRYRTADLDVDYQLALATDGTLTVTIVDRNGVTRRTITGMKPSPRGGYKGANLEIVPDDDLRGFQLETDRVTLAFVRAS